MQIKVLNSGLLPLAFTFGKVVVGPDLGNVGEILKQCGNPVFDPKNYRSASVALMQGIELSKEGKGEENYLYAKENWSQEATQEKYEKLFEELICH
jgi:glycosyltransferase involved in cell wall biosynthesis